MVNTLHTAVIFSSRTLVLVDSSIIYSDTSVDKIEILDVFAFFLTL